MILDIEIESRLLIPYTEATDDMMGEFNNNLLEKYKRIKVPKIIFLCLC